MGKSWSRYRYLVVSKHIPPNVYVSGQKVVTTVKNPGGHLKVTSANITSNILTETMSGILWKIHHPVVFLKMYNLTFIMRNWNWRKFYKMHDQIFFWSVDVMTLPGKNWETVADWRSLRRQHHSVRCRILESTLKRKRPCAWKNWWNLNKFCSLVICY